MSRIKITLEYDHYTTDGKTFKKGDRFIGVNYEKFKENSNSNDGGGGSPCNNRDEAMDELKRLTKGLKEKDVELINKTKENITKGELFGQSLNNWLG